MYFRNDVDTQLSQREFEVQLKDNAAMRMLGIKVFQDRDNNCLKVLEIAREGRIGDWNLLQENEYKLQVNDWIRAVDTQTGIDPMISTLGEARTKERWVKLYVVRGEAVDTPGSRSSCDHYPSGEWF